MKKNYLLLMLVFVLFLGGCSDEVNESEAQVLANKTVKINEDQYYTMLFSTNYDAKLKVEVEVIDGSPIEGYFMRANDYNTFDSVMKNNSDSPVTYIKALSHQSISYNFSSEWTSIPKGSYAFVVENTDFGSTQPYFDGVNNYSYVRITIKGVID